MPILALVAFLSPVVLYDAASDTLPQDAPWFWGLVGVGGSVTPPGGTQKTILDTTANLGIQRGWLNVVQAGLDPFKRPRVTFDLRVVAESHSNADRAGVSVIVTCSDKKGVEISFWQNEVWAQDDSPLFTHGEGAPLDTTAHGSGRGGLRRYTLVFDRSRYWLTVDGQPLLSGPRKDYRAFTGNPDPYEIPNVLWVGDDTQSASARFEFSYFESGSVLPAASTLGG